MYLPLPQIHETIESINQLKTQRDFMLSFSTDPQDFIQEWLRSQRRDLKVWSFPGVETILSSGWFYPHHYFGSRGRLAQEWELCYHFPPGSLQIITDVIGNPEEERRAAFYHQPWAQEAVGRHIFAKVRLCSVCPPVVEQQRPELLVSLFSRCSSEGKNWNRCWEFA